MEEQQCSVRIGDEIRKYDVGTTYQEIAEEYQSRYPYQIVLAYEDGKLVELRKKVKKDCTISFETTADKAGHDTYKRSMSFLMVKAIYDVCKHADIDKVRIHYSISKGYYCTVEGRVTVDQDFLDKVNARMRDLVDMDIPIKKRSMSTDDAIALFRQLGMYDKEELFRYRRGSKVNVYSINDFQDYYYGYMVPSTGYLQYFKLYRYDEGFVLQMPDISDPTEVPAFDPPGKLFHVLKESTRWGDMQGIEAVGALNDRITGGDISELVLVQEALQEKKIADIAVQIAGNPSVKFVLIAGPSSSGKTTFSHRLAVQLRANGMTPHLISVDNYFVEREENPVDENGNLDFECLEAVDVGLLNEQLQELLDGKEVVMPTFDFETGHKEFKAPSIRLGKEDVLVIEGIHCLNPELTRNLDNDSKFKIYISALTQLNIDEHNRIPTTDGRLIRRIVRDSRTRGTSAKETITRWDAVRKGEEQNIFPYQEQADAMFNSALIYELAVLKPYAEAQLFRIDRDDPTYIEAKRLLKFLDYFVGIDSEYVPTNSLLREFIGGGCFNVS